MTERQEIPAEVERWLDIMYRRIIGPLPKGGEQTMKCPNCDEEMGYDEETESYECPGCGYKETY